MKTKNVIGQKIVAVEQSRVHLSGRRSTITVDALVLENGVQLVPIAYETGAEPIGDLQLLRKVRLTKPF